MPSTAIQREWLTYRNDVIPNAASSTQLQESRRAFYAGAWAAMNLLRRTAEDDISLDSGAAIFESLLEECRLFNAKIQRGEA